MVLHGHLAVSLPISERCRAPCPHLHNAFPAQLPRTLLPSRRGGRWAEDEGYTAQLGRGWQLEGVREACYHALATVGKDAMHFRCARLRDQLCRGCKGVACGSWLVVSLGLAGHSCLLWARGAHVHACLCKAQTDSQRLLHVLCTSLQATQRDERAQGEAGSCQGAASGP